MVIGFVGFGEANSSIAQGLREEGISEIVCYDAMQADPRFRDKIAQKAAACGAKQLENSALVCQTADIVISGTPSSFALGAAEQAGQGAHEGLIYIDVSTATPKDKKQMAQCMESKGAAFVDGAMMGTLLKDRHQVPMLLCGSGAEAFKKAMEPYHMRLTVVQGEPGTATREPYAFSDL